VNTHGYAHHAHTCTHTQLLPRRLPEPRELVELSIVAVFKGVYLPTALLEPTPFFERNTRATEVSVSASLC
jgi:hypothetical protein